MSPTAGEYIWAKNRSFQVNIQANTEFFLFWFCKNRFIELDCDSKDTMLNIVMQLRCLTLADEYIHARLKSSTLHQAPTLDPVATVIAEQVARSRKKKRGLRRNKKKKLANDNQERQKQKEETAQLKKGNSTKERSQETIEQNVNLPPSLDTTDFPSLLAKTTDSTTSRQDHPNTSGQQSKCSGYAAALLKSSSASSKVRSEKKPSKSKTQTFLEKHDRATTAVETGSSRPSQIKSFADAARSISLAS